MLVRRVVKDFVGGVSETTLFVGARDTDRRDSLGSVPLRC